MKDQNAAQNLLEEIETAKLSHPTPRQSSSFTSRVDTLGKRLVLRGDPMSNPGIFPRPTHPLFPDQLSFNNALVQSLSTEFATATDLITKVDTLAKEYRANYEAVKEADLLSQSANGLLSTVDSIITRLSHGVSTYEGDGSPPDLSSEACLQPTRHATFLALLPTLLEETEQTNSAAEKLICSYQLALLNLDRPGIDLSFKQHAVNQLDTLIAAHDKLCVLANDTNTRVGYLRVVRKVWSIMVESLKLLQNIQSEVREMMERERWKPLNGTGVEPLTPETPRSRNLDPIDSSSDILKRFDIVRETLSHDAAIPLASLSGSLEASLGTFLTQTYDGLVSRLENLNQMVQLLDAVKAQSAAMTSLREEVDELQVQIEDLVIRYDATTEETLSGNLLPERISELYSELQAGANSLSGAVKIFTDGVARRVPLVASNPRDQTSATFIRKKLSSTDAQLGVAISHISVELPFSLASLDDNVRADSNFLVMRLSGQSETLHRKADHLQLARMSRDVGATISSTTHDLHGVTQDLESLWISFTSLPQTDSKLQDLQELAQSVEEHYTQHRSRLSRTLSMIRESIRHMESVPASCDLHFYETLLSSCRRGVNDLEIKVNSWADRVTMVRGKVSEALLFESQRLEALRVQREQEAEEKRQQAEHEYLVNAALREAERLATEERRHVKHVLVEGEEPDVHCEGHHQEQAKRYPQEVQEPQEEEQRFAFITIQEVEEFRQVETKVDVVVEGRGAHNIQCMRAEMVGPRGKPVDGPEFVQGIRLSSMTDATEEGSCSSRLIVAVMTLTPRRIWPARSPFTVPYQGARERRIVG